MASVQPNQKNGKNAKDRDNIFEEDQSDKDIGSNINIGPPGFYDADIEKYYAKFEGSRKARQEFKQRMKGKMSFTDTNWNSNVVETGTTHGNRKSKQVVKVVNGLAQTLKSSEHQKP